MMLKRKKRQLRRFAEKGYFLPEEIKFQHQKNSIEFSDYDVTLISLLAKGYRQQNRRIFQKKRYKTLWNKFSRKKN